LDIADRLANWDEIRNYYLTGGTALSLKIGHRRSLDLDFFTRQTVGSLPNFPKLIHEINWLGNTERLLN
jgi:hypothetical protein